ncbi:GNAT family N-acetyltransferase [Pedobacter flavus]|uniref:GNAT family protein n=1 Tax=Pedobacter flavus TaxID=3113906 RepID=A0ABU7H3X5_9SPHI|nr:GNAT family protein [Pedobacter sp. VNH31]MEE1886027.1 GNAT family protein [Pedobacter sp. VNH31]
MNYGFANFNVAKIFAITDPRNINSKQVLSKLGFVFKETFDYKGDPTDWYELKKTTWENKNLNC